MSSAWEANIRRIEAALSTELLRFSGIDAVAQTRVLGGIGVIEMKVAVNLAEIQKQFVAESIWVRPFGKLVYVMQPYIITDDELSRLMQGIFNVLSTA